MFMWKLAAALPAFSSKSRGKEEEESKNEAPRIVDVMHVQWSDNYDKNSDEQQ